jgi:YHS domain-containing protein
MNARRWTAAAIVTIGFAAMVAGPAFAEPEGDKPAPAAPAAPAPAADDGLDPNVARDVSQFNLDKEGVAIGGYDPVSYFEGKGVPQKGDAAITYRYRGVNYRFASAEHLETFKKDPTRYEPSHGGWCSTAMVEGQKVEINPKAFRVTDGRLFLFYKTVLYDARDAWTKDEPASTTKADGNWKKLSGIDPPKPENASPGAQGASGGGK